MLSGLGGNAASVSLADSVSELPLSDHDRVLRLHEKPSIPPSPHSCLPLYFLQPSAMKQLKTLMAANVSMNPSEHQDVRDVYVEKIFDNRIINSLRFAIRNSIPYYEIHIFLFGYFYMTGSKPKNLVQTIERAAFIFDILSQSPNGLSLGDLAHKANLPKGTAHRLLSSMAYFDLIRQEPTTKNYHLGFKLVDLGNLLLMQIDLRSQARSFLINLSETVKETVHLVVLDKDKALYVDKVNLHQKASGLQMVSRLGSRIALHCSSVGKVLLAYMEKSDAENLISDIELAKRTQNTISDPKELMQHLSFVRENGYAIDDEENEEGIRCVAAPIRNGSGRVEAAVSISGPTTRITMERIETELKKLICETANGISAQLGCKDL